MTKGDWEKYLAGKNKYIRPGRGNLIAILNRKSKVDYYEPWVAKSVAAYCLHEKAFGFTQADVEVLRLFADSGVGEMDMEGPAHYPHLGELASRIEALLPPKG